MAFQGLMHLWEAAPACWGREEICEQVALPQVAHPTLLQPSLLPASYTILTWTWVGKEDNITAFGKDFFPLLLEHFGHCSPWLPVQKVELKIPLFSPSITTTLPWHTTTLSSSQWQTSITEAQSSECFQLILQTFCAIHHSFLLSGELNAVNDQR